jgi:intermediate cleaving peptidase 55
MTLFCKGKNLHKEKWDGASTSLNAAKVLFAADDALPISSIGTYLKSLTLYASNVYVDLLDSPAKPLKKNASSLLKYLTGSEAFEKDPLFEIISSSQRRPLAPQLGKLRAIKSKAEQKAMHGAATISGRAHAKVNSFNIYWRYHC